MDLIKADSKQSQSNSKFEFLLDDIQCPFCLSLDTEYRRYGFDPMFIQLACFECAKIYSLRAEVDKIEIVDVW